MIAVERMETDTTATCARCRAYQPITALVRVTTAAAHAGTDLEMTLYICKGCAGDLAGELHLHARLRRQPRRKGSKR